MSATIRRAVLAGLVVLPWLTVPQAGFARPPLFTLLPIPDQTIGAAQVFRVLAKTRVEDPTCWEEGPITYSLTTAPSGMSIQGGKLTWQPSCSEVGRTFPVTIHATAPSAPGYPCYGWPGQANESFNLTVAASPPGICGYGAVVQDRGNIRIGPVEDGLGSGPLPGNYEVTLRIKSHRRWAVYADDGGHEEWYCGIPDEWASVGCGPQLPPTYPGGTWPNWVNDWAWIDGIKLKKDDLSHVCGYYPHFVEQREIAGSLNYIAETKWEWPSESWLRRNHLSDAVRKAERDTQILELRYNVSWSGSRLRSVFKAQWLESEAIWSDDSEWAYFNTGDMLTRCLQGGGGSAGKLRSILDASEEYFWFLCSEDGTCYQFLNYGTGGLHFNIATYFHVECEWDPATATPIQLWSCPSSYYP